MSTGLNESDANENNRLIIESIMWELGEYFNIFKRFCKEVNAENCLERLPFIEEQLEIVNIELTLNPDFPQDFLDGVHAYATGIKGHIEDMMETENVLEFYD